MSVERFIREYAAYKITNLPEDISNDERIEYVNNIEKVIKSREKGIITADEAILSILNRN